MSDPDFDVGFVGVPVLDGDDDDDDEGWVRWLVAGAAVSAVAAAAAAANVFCNARPERLLLAPLVVCRFEWGWC